VSEREGRGTETGRGGAERRPRRPRQPLSRSLVLPARCRVLCGARTVLPRARHAQAPRLAATVETHPAPRGRATGARRVGRYGRARLLISQRQPPPPPPPPSASPNLRTSLSPAHHQPRRACKKDQRRRRASRMIGSAHGSLAAGARRVGVGRARAQAAAPRARATYTSAASHSSAASCDGGSGRSSGRRVHAASGGLCRSGALRRAVRGPAGGPGAGRLRGPSALRPPEDCVARRPVRRARLLHLAVLRRAVHLLTCCC
jgi:hypothetical protein